MPVKAERSMVIKMKIVWIRHGATASNAQGLYLGRTDEALSEVGIRALCKQKQAGKYPAVQMVAASPMKRCVQTAELIYAGLEVRLVEEFREIDFGSFEGQSYLTLQHQKAYQDWLASNGTLPFPQGEKRGQFIARCMRGFDQLGKAIRETARMPAGMPDSIALVVHGGTIMAILSTLLGEDYFSFQCGNGEGYCTTIHWGKEPVIQKVTKL